MVPKKGSFLTLQANYTRDAAIVLKDNKGNEQDKQEAKKRNCTSPFIHRGSMAQNCGCSLCLCLRLISYCDQAAVRTCYSLISHF